MSTVADVAAKRLALVSGGYVPVPLNGKRPWFDGWQLLRDVSDEQIQMWATTWPKAINTGVLTRRTPALDIDILNEEAARAIEDHVRGQYEDKGPILVRIGLPPKRAILFRTAEPFDKIVVNVVAPNGSGDASEKIEFLCNGQQVVVSGIHPDTKRPYVWIGGEPGKIKNDDLPYIREDQARRLVDEVVEILVRDFGYSLGKRNTTNTKDKSDAADDWEFLYENIREGRELHDSLCALAAKLIATGTTEEAAIGELRTRMEHSNAPHDKRWQERFDDIENLVASAVEKFEQAVTVQDFHAYMPTHQYIFTSTGEMWPAVSIDTRIPRQRVKHKGKTKLIKTSAWLDYNRAVEQMTWAPGLPQVIENRLISDGGWIERRGVRCFNLYRPPIIKPGDPDKAGPWKEHVQKVYPKDADHIIRFLAHRKQRPQDKINHALLLGGDPGIGKDTLLEGSKRAVGPWNFKEIVPHNIMESFNPHVKAVVLRINEARDLGDVNRFQFYEHMKLYTAAPPDVLRCNEKYVRQYYVPNVCGVIITTNHKTDGIYLPADDRRHYVAWSDLVMEDFETGYWDKLWGWYDSGGDRHVAAYLATLDLSEFNPKAPPKKTAAFWEIVDANRAPEDAELADVLDQLDNPDAITLVEVENRAVGDFQEWIGDRKNRRQIPYRFEQCGYVPIRNDAAKDGLWKIGDYRQVIYVKEALPISDRLKAARARVDKILADIARARTVLSGR